MNHFLSTDLRTEFDLKHFRKQFQPVPSQKLRHVRQGNDAASKINPGSFESNLVSEQQRASNSPLLEK